MLEPLNDKTNLKLLDPLHKIFTAIDMNVDENLKLLRDAVSIQSVSSLPSMREEVLSMVKWTERQLNLLGMKTETVWMGLEKLPNKTTIPVPPVLLAKYGHESEKRTILIYGHLDVHPAAKSDGWSTNPFDLTMIDKKLYGRGASDNKGPILCWLNAIRAYYECKSLLPVNIKFLLESTEECGSIGLKKVLEEKESFFKDISYTCVTDCSWLGADRPCLIYGYRGLCIFHMEIQCADQDLHSGIYGGLVNEAMTDMIHMLTLLVDTKGNILIPHVTDDVVEISEEEKKQFLTVDFDVVQYKAALGAKKLKTEDKEEILTNLWTRSSLIIHDIEGCFDEPGIKPVIPRKVLAKFSIRLVPNQDPMKIEKTVVKYLTHMWFRHGTKNKFRVYMVHGTKPWVTNPNSKWYKTAAKATKFSYGVYPDLIREAGQIPVVRTLEDTLKKEVVCLPIGSSDDGAGSTNERLSLMNYNQGAKQIAAFIHLTGLDAYNPRETNLESF